MMMLLVCVSRKGVFYLKHMISLALYLTLFIKFKINGSVIKLGSPQLAEIFHIMKMVSVLTRQKTSCDSDHK